MSEKISLNPGTISGNPGTHLPVPGFREKNRKKKIERNFLFLEKWHHLRGNGDDFFPGDCENASYERLPECRRGYIPQLGSASPPVVDICERVSCSVSLNKEMSYFRSLFNLCRKY